MTDRFIHYVAIASTLLPALVAARLRVRSRPLRALALYSLLLFVQSVFMTWFSSRGTTNLWLIHVFLPVQAVLFLYILAHWQKRETARNTVLLTIPLFLLVWGGLTFTLESLSAFPRYVKTLEGLLLVALGAYTLIARAQTITAPITRYPWFWVCTGIVLQFAFAAIVNPVAYELLRYAGQSVSWMYSVNRIVVTVADLLFVRAMFLAGAVDDGLAERRRHAPAPRLAS
jgi:hypothetical protein